MEREVTEIVGCSPKDLPLVMPRPRVPKDPQFMFLPKEMDQSGLTPKQCYVLQQLDRGFSLTKAAELANVSRAAVYKWDRKG